MLLMSFGSLQAGISFTLCSNHYLSFLTSRVGVLMASSFGSISALCDKTRQCLALDDAFHRPSLETIQCGFPAFPASFSGHKRRASSSVRFRWGPIFELDLATTFKKYRLRGSVTSSRPTLEFHPSAQILHSTYNHKVLFNTVTDRLKPFTRSSKYVRHGLNSGELGYPRFRSSRLLNIVHRFRRPEDFLMTDCWYSDGREEEEEQEAEDALQRGCHRGEC
ncbi:hypothetical protein K438DRAFT_1811569 [Mycena galopus ATCC 62051]|nr:hypothetical protein K438DRAFT_1811569 [Mycena galopus ATCC 62051]